MIVSIAQTQVFFLVFTRIMAMVIPVPVLGGQTIPAQVRIGLGIILSAILIPWQPLGPEVEELGLLAFAAGIFQEIIIGALAGFAATLTFGAIQIAGEMMGIVSGFGAGNILNPSLGSTGSALDQLFVMVGMLFFLVLDGHHYFLMAVQKSFSVIPVNTPVPFTDPTTLLTMTANLITTGVQMALPVIGALLLADISMGLLARVAPQIQIFFLGLPAKVGLGMIAVGLTFGVALPVMRDLFQKMGPRLIELVSR
jgi:flagellar biosynthetic protein FliR